MSSRKASRPSAVPIRPFLHDLNLPQLRNNQLCYRPPLQILLSLFQTISSHFAWFRKCRTHEKVGSKSPESIWTRGGSYSQPPETCWIRPRPSGGFRFQAQNNYHLHPLSRRVINPRAQVLFGDSSCHFCHLAARSLCMKPH